MQDRRAGRAVDWCFRDRRTGRIVIAQFPNAALWVFLATVALRWIVPSGTDARTALEWIGLGALGWWSADEVLRGVNPWRRLLGTVGCAVVVSGLLSKLG